MIVKHQYNSSIAGNYTATRPC